jgi:hypothetical protein
MQDSPKVPKRPNVPKRRKIPNWIFPLSAAIIVLIDIIILSRHFSSNYFPQAATRISTPPPTLTSVPTIISPTPTEQQMPTTAPTSWPLPQFPWPPPEPSAKVVLPLGSLAELVGHGLNLYAVEQRISGALYWAGYDELSYFAVPNGFAIVTRLEMMDENGYPETSSRWASSLKPINFTEFSTLKYLQALFGAPQGHYRVLVFIVTSDLVVQSGTAVAQGTAQTWIVQGANKFPRDMDLMPYTSEYTTTVYIYEFIQSGVNANANQNIPSSLTGKQHLERAGLWNMLNADCFPDPYQEVPITYGNSVKGTLCIPDEYWDEFSFSGSHGDKIRIQLKATETTVAPCIDLWMITPDFKEILLGCENEQTTTLEQTGTYVIWLSGWRYTNMPINYTLVVERIQ